MDEDLLEAFWAQSTPYVRRLLLKEAAGRSSGAAQFELDVVDVVLDFDRQVAMVHDVLDEGRSAVAPLEAFLTSAAVYGDDPSAGDGLTQMQRTPAAYRAAVRRHGRANRAGDLATMRAGAIGSWRRGASLRSRTP